MNDVFLPTRTAALERLSRFVPLAGRTYAARRNYDLGAGRHEAVSTLSPYVRCRLLSEEEVLQAVLARHSYGAAEKFVQEVFWRTYWKGWLELRPGVWQQYQQGLTRAWDDVQTQGGLRARWEAACRGETGIACFDSWADELAETGYLHNHARMWFASIWVFTLELPWELGADFFLRHLLDGDPASNTLSWRWVAGIQTQGKTYLARTSNISKYTEGRFHPKWQLAGVAEPRPAPPLPAPRLLPPDGTPVAGLKTGFLLHEEDLGPGYALERLTGGCALDSCAVLAPQTGFGPLQAAPRVAAFRTACLQDAATRWGAHLGDVNQVTGLAELKDWAARRGLDQIVTAYAPVGPVAGVLAALAAAPDAPDVVQLRRPYDAMAWPHATRGFFPFKKKIPDLLAQLDLAERV